MEEALDPKGGFFNSFGVRVMIVVSVRVCVGEILENFGVAMSSGCSDRLAKKSDYSEISIAFV